MCLHHLHLSIANFTPQLPPAWPIELILKVVSKTLIIAEKPSVARDIAAALPQQLQKQGSTHLESDDWIVTWAVGHLLRLQNPDEYKPEWKSWRLSELPLLPEKFKLKPASSKTAAQLKAVKQLMGRDDVSEVVNACDAGREGELIFRYIAQYSKLKKPVKRLWLASLTAEAIQEGLKSIKPGGDYDLLADAARGRSEADWLVGMNASRAATLVLRDWLGGAASMGRVQTPTLAILVRREQEIEAFDCQDYWTVEAEFVCSEGRGYRGYFEDGKRFPSLAEAQMVVEATKGHQGVVSALEKKSVTEKQPQLYDLTSLQREASSAFGFTAAETLQIAQELYEKHKLLTYPRTDSRFLPKAEGEKLDQLLRDVSKLAPYQPHCERLLAAPIASDQVVNDAKVSDHYAIIPTGKIPSTSMAPDEKRVYDMVARRLIAALDAPCLAERTRIETTVEEKMFVTKGRRVSSPGWREVYQDVAWVKDDQQQLPAIEKGEQATPSEVSAPARQTKPPKRLNDASMLGMMETAGRLVEDDEAREAMKESGLGTPATRAATLERLIEVGYASRDKRALIPTAKGISLITLLGDHPLASPQLTGDWEHALSRIEAGELELGAFIASIFEFCSQIVEGITALPEKLTEVPKLPVEQRSPGRKPSKPLGDDIMCPGCGKQIFDGPKAWSCWQPGDPGCGLAIWKEVAGLKLEKSVALELLGPEAVTAEKIDGFTSRKGAKFSAKLALAKGDEGKWKTSFVFDDSPRAQIAGQSSADL